MGIEQSSKAPQRLGEQQARLIIEAMESSSMSQADLARAAKVPPYTVSRLISGRNVASGKSARALERALGLPLHTLGTNPVEGSEGQYETISSIRSLGDGREEVQLRFVADRLSRLAIEAVMNANRPITYQKLSKLISILAADEAGDNR